MFDGFKGFDEAFADAPVAPVSPGSVPPLRRRKSLKQRLVFYAANLFIMPIICLVYATIIADGIRHLMPIFRRRLYSLPIPGAGLARQYDGWDRADLAIIVSVLLFVVVTWVWTKVFVQLQQYELIAAQLARSPIVLRLLAFLAAVLVVGDAGIFYVGLASQNSAGWSEAPTWVVPAATLIYSSGIAVIGWWHSDYQHQTSTLV